MNINKDESTKADNLVKLSDTEIGTLLSSLKLCLWLVEWVHPRISPNISASSPYEDTTTPQKWIQDLDNVLRKLRSKSFVSPADIPDIFYDTFEIIEQYSTIIARKKYTYHLRHLFDPINDQTGEPIEHPGDNFTKFIYGDELELGGGTCRL